MPGVRDSGDGGGVGVTMKEVHEGDLCGNGIVLYLDAGDSYGKLYM